MSEAISVLVAGVAAYGFGAVWYMALGKRWMAAVGLTEAELRGGAPTPFIIAAINALIVAGALRLVFDRIGVEDALSGLRWGALLGVFVALPWIVTNYAFAGRPRALWWIDGGHAAIAVSIAGLALGALR